MDPADFYTGLVADLYGPLRSVRQTAAPYENFNLESGEPALELGCGDGDPLLELRRRGLDVDGVDSSADMLARLRARAEDAGLTVAVHHQRMEDLDLPRRYRSIFLAGPTFNLLPDDETAGRALTRIRAHLAEGGTALVPLFIPDPVPASAIGTASESTTADGARLRCTTVAGTRDEERRTQRTALRYERDSPSGAPDVLERDWLLHWHTTAGFTRLAEAAGLRTAAVRTSDGEPAAPDATSFTFWLTAEGDS
ncbi:class I SAM-dependent methyltransferase [Occultella glacieicola]|uniref:Class I SAM-dependent methyltransferase n=1 Tax=Occultella glacieicola TaxID=2518684 RepID=A0ABY2E790_9MICO|nr:class I SAM-dependent methyltransferase [Occultella glacieicola]TDE95923.1 class I SAM-dependent methyltransferase [Occultella glacieicola]